MMKNVLRKSALAAALGLTFSQLSYSVAIYGINTMDTLTDFTAVSAVVRVGDANCPTPGGDCIRLRNSSSLTLTSPVDASGSTGLTVNYDARPNSIEAGEEVYVEYSIDNAAWNTVKTYTSVDSGTAFLSESVDISAADGAATLYIRFTSTGSANNDHFLIDNLSIEDASIPANSPGVASIDNTSPVVGDILNASIVDADGTGTSSFTYQWLSAGAQVGINDAAYTVALGDIGNAISVNITYADDQLNSEDATSLLTDTVTAPQTTGVVSIDNSSPIAGDTLNALVSDADGITASSFTYVWAHSVNGIVGTDSPSYTTVIGDAGGTIGVNVTYTDDMLNAEDINAVVTASVSAPGNNVGSISISGILKDGNTVSALVNDDDGTASATIIYTWTHSVNGIVGGDSSTYDIQVADIGGTLTVNVTYTDDLLNAEDNTSVASAQVTDSTATPPPAPAPAPETGSSNLGLFLLLLTAGGLLTCRRSNV